MKIVIVNIKSQNQQCVKGFIFGGEFTIVRYSSRTLLCVDGITYLLGNSVDEFFESGIVGGVIAINLAQHPELASIFHVSAAA